MDLDFYKLQIAGNDLILVNYSDLIFPDAGSLQETARFMCRRDYGIGGNGLIALKSFSEDAIEASFIDPAGGFSGTTTDAALCLSRYIFDSGVTGKEDFSIKINDITHDIGVIDSNNFRLSLGVPLDEEGTELVEHPDRDYIKQINAGGNYYPATVINLRKTGIVIFSAACNLSHLKTVSDIILQASEIDSSQRLIFAVVNSREEIEVYIRNSRGDDFSSSCAIAAISAVVNGFLDRSAAVIHKKGEFYFQWLQPSNEVFLTGSPDYIFSGSIFLDF